MKIKQDKFASSPRDWDNLGTFVMWHRRYNFGDIDPSPESPQEFLRELGDVIILPVYGYDHGIMTISTQVEKFWWHYAWDGRQLGWIYVSKDKIRDEYGWKRLTKQRQAKVEKILRQEIETLDQYLRGDVWGFIIYDDETDEILDSCWGFIGQDDCKADGGNALQYFQRNEVKNETIEINHVQLSFL